MNPQRPADLRTCETIKRGVLGDRIATLRVRMRRPIAS